MLAGGFLADAAFRLMSIAPFDGVDPWATTIQVLVVDVQVAAAMPAALLMRGSRTVGYLASVALAAGGVAALKVVEVAHRAMIGG
jgi:hypothetical protein